jgi:transcriptional regulator of acetoin/glycerol metabolism
MKRFLRQGPTGRLEVNISGRLVQYLIRHPLPGNVRELDAVLTKVANACPDHVLRLPEVEAGATPSSAPPARNVAAEVGPDGLPTDAALVAVLEAAEWNVTRAGRMLGMGRNAVQRMMDKRGIKRDKTRP